MKTMIPDDETTMAAARHVVDFTLLAFAPDVLLWEPSTNTAIAMCAWNCDASNSNHDASNHDASNRGAWIREVPAAQGAALISSFPDERMDRLFQRLLDARRTRWKDCDFLVEDLDVDTVGRELLFRFRLRWDGGTTGRPCEITVPVFSEEEALDLR